MQSTREDELAYWLESTAPPMFQSSPRLLVEANVEKDALEPLIGQFSVPVLHDVLTRIIAEVGAEKRVR